MLSTKKITNKISLIAYLIANGISIPHYCYHNNLSIAVNCRVCIVELKNSMKPIVSCATNVNATLLDIYHQNALTKKARENTFKRVLFNHPVVIAGCDCGHCNPSRAGRNLPWWDGCNPPIADCDWDSDCDDCYSDWDSDIETDGDSDTDTD